MKLWHGSTSFLFLLLAGLLTLSACDSNSGDLDPGEVAGEYVFNRFEFIPDSDLLVPVNVLDTLVTTGTRLQLFSSGRFTLLYEFQGGRPEFIGGDFEVDGSRITLKGDRDDEARYRDLLLGLDTELLFETGGGFAGSIERRVNLEAFSDRYKGLPAVDGTLEVRMSRR